MAVNPMAALQAAASAIGAVVDQVRKLPDAVRGFVDAFSPATGQRLDQSFRSLHATIGYALEPVLHTAIALVDGFADAISRGMDRLRGPVEAVTSAFAGSLRPALGAVAAAFDGLAGVAETLRPLVEPLGTALEGLASLARVVTTLLSALAEALAGAVMEGLGNLRAATDWLAEQFVSTAGVVLHFSDALLRAAGLGDVADKAIRRMLAAVPQGGRRQGAPENFGISGIDDLYRRRLVEAARGGGRSKEDMTFDVWRRIQGLLEELVRITENKDAQAQRDRGLEQGFQAGGGNNAWAINQLVNLMRQENRNGLRAALPPQVQNLLNLLGL